MHIKSFYRFLLHACMCTIMTLSLAIPIAAEETEQTIKHESGIYYTIQKGDTLWDLSQRFYDSPALWPDLWKENNQIPNPHWIEPGERIRLYHQSGAQQIKLLKKIEKKSPVKTEQPQADETRKDPPYYYYSPINSIGFIRKTPQVPEGTIFRAKENKVMISIGDTVYIKPENNYSLAVGQQYTVYRIVTSARNKNFKEYMGNYGFQHYLTGVVKIKGFESDYYYATVTHSYRDIRVNDQLMPYKPRSPKVYLAESQEGILGQIITNEDRDRMFADNVIAFIDKGRKDGIKTGQFYSVFYQEEHGLKFSDKKMGGLLTPIDFGNVLVLDTEEETATVLVTYSEKDMYPTVNIRTPIK